MTRRRALRAGRLGRRARSGDSITGSERSARPSGPPVLRTRSGPLVLDRVALVGILNATPDSFSEGGRHLDPGRAAAAAAEMVAEGAAMLDVGAESTRPGAPPVPADEERRRLLPVLRAVRAAVRGPISGAARAAGVAADAIVVDPGIGFGKTVAHNCALLARLDLVASLGYPVLVGVSRKGFIGQLLGERPTNERLLGTAAAVALAVARGA